MTSTTDQLCLSNTALEHQVPVEEGTEPSFPLSGTRNLEEIPRELGHIDGAEAGPTLICLGGLHGNEPAGVIAIQRVLADLEGEEAGIKGHMIGVVGNRQALAADRRFLKYDLNRAWHPDRLTRLRTKSVLDSGEDHEQVELDDVLSKIIGAAAGRLFLLDIHTTSGPGPAFAILDDSLPNREVALDFPVPLVFGLEEELSGTLASHLALQAVTALGFEAGQHTDPRSVDRAEAAIWVALESGGFLKASLRERVRQARQFLIDDSEIGRRFFEVRHRHALSSKDGFRMKAGYQSFGPVEAGEKIGTSSDGDVAAPFGGRLLMPLYQDQGEDGFFLVREVRPAWLPVSSAMRRLRLERYLHLLPGVQRHPLRGESFIVDLRYARWKARQLFHLLGFRREGRLDRILVMTRREDRDI
jgi:succinylglutamate desuccinylase